MLVDFKTLPEYSVIWIYQSSRAFTDKELEEIDQDISVFLTQWKSHDEDLLSSYEIKYNRFIIIAANQDYQQPSGCAIDAQIHLIQEIEKRYDVSLLDKMNVSFREGKSISYKELKEFRKMLKNNVVNKKTIVFNNVVSNIGEYQSYWEVPVLESWHKRLMR